MQEDMQHALTVSNITTDFGWKQEAKFSLGRCRHGQKCNITHGVIKQGAKVGAHLCTCNEEVTILM
jgi:hypothetical protein